MQLYCCRRQTVSHELCVCGIFLFLSSTLKKTFEEMQYQRFNIGFLRKLFVVLLVCIPAIAFAQEEEKESAF